MSYFIRSTNTIGKRDIMIYGQFIEHFHRQIYGGVYDPSSEFADEDGFRTDVLSALRDIKVPILRWPGGCFVSSHNWKKGVGQTRTPVFDKAWRVEEPNTFGTDEYIKLCRKLNCEPYICTNAGTGTIEEMSDWVEYCNLAEEGEYAAMRKANGSSTPHNVRYWSIGNENYGSWELGAKSATEWGRLVTEAAKLMKHVDPTIELSAAALADPNWNMELLSNAAPYLDWVSIHEYWDPIHTTNALATYEQCMAYTANLSGSIERVRGLLMALGLDKRLRISFDEWNLRGWYHPGMHVLPYANTKAEYLAPRDKNDDNSSYTMADAVFTACFLNTLLRNCDIVGMAGYAPAVNTRGLIYTHKKGIVLRSTYYVFKLYANLLGDIVLNTFCDSVQKYSVQNKQSETVEVDAVDIIVTRHSDTGVITAAAVNKHASEPQAITFSFDDKPMPKGYTIHTLTAPSPDSYNDINHTATTITTKTVNEPPVNIEIPPHSVNIIDFNLA